MFLVLETNRHTAELRTISQCDSDMFMRNFKANHRKLGAHSPADSYYSGTESQQSISGRSLYDNVDIEAESKPSGKSTKDFLMPPKAADRNSAVFRSKSFQETGQCRRHLNPFVPLRRNFHESSSLEDKIESASNHSSSPYGSGLSESNIEYTLSPADVIVFPNCTCDRKSNDPFYLKILRRIQKLSCQLRKCKKSPRGRPLLIYIVNNFRCAFNDLTLSPAVLA